MVLDMKESFPFLDAMVSMTEFKFGDVGFVKISRKFEEVLEGSLKKRKQG